MHKPCSIWPLYIRPETGYGVKVVDGSKHYAATLDEDVVEYIRTVYIPRCKQYGQSALARRFGVNQSTVSRALKGDTW